MDVLVDIIITIIIMIRILDNLEVHILATANPDGWNRAEEGLCSGQVCRDRVSWN